MTLLRRFLSTSLGWLIAGVWFLCQALLIAWAALAIYYSNLPWTPLRQGLAVAFAVFAIWALWFSRRRHMSTIFIVLYLCVVAWWISISPSHDRNWRPEVAVMPRAVIDGDRVHLTGVRDFDYRSRNDFTVRYEEREVLLSHLVAIDFYVSYFMEGPVGHTFLSFIFDNAPPLSISIETRPEVGEGFAPVASMFIEDAEPLSPGDFIGKWMKLMAPAMDKIGSRGAMTPTEYLRKLEQANVVNSLDNLMTFPRLRKLIERGSVSIHGAYFGVATGSLLVCDREGSEFVPVAQAEHAKLLQAPRF